jgi:hypothetical protein
MKHAKLGFAQYRTPMLAVMITLGTLMIAQPSHAAACVNGVYRAGCVGPNGAVGVRKAYPRHGLPSNPDAAKATGSVLADFAQKATD